MVAAVREEASRCFAPRAARRWLSRQVTLVLRRDPGGGEYDGDEGGRGDETVEGDEDGREVLLGWSACPGPVSCWLPAALQPEGEHGEAQGRDDGDDGAGRPRDRLGR